MNLTSRMFETYLLSRKPFLKISVHLIFYNLETICLIVSRRHLTQVTQHHHTKIERLNAQQVIISKRYDFKIGDYPNSKPHSTNNGP